MARSFPPETVATFLGQTALLRNVALDDLFELASGAEQRTYDTGALIVKPGKNLSGLGLLLKGTASLCAVDAASGDRSQIEQLMPGDPFGEIGLLLGTVNPLAVVVEDEAQALLISKDLVQKALRKNPSIALVLAKRVAKLFVRVTMLGLGDRVASTPGGPGGSRPAPAPEAPKPRARRPDEFPFVEINRFDISRDVLGMIPTQLIRQHRVLPLEFKGKTLMVGMVNPFSLEAKRDLRRVLHTADPEYVAIGGDDFNQAVLRLKLDAQRSSKAAVASQRQQTVSYAVEQEKAADKGQVVIGEEIIRLLDKIFIEAVQLNASDIHIEPDANRVLVRYRISGTLVNRQEYVPQSFATPLFARIKVLAELDITERRMPQDGRIVATMGKTELNVRVSTMAIARGEKAVLRLIDPSDVMRPLHQIFADPQVTERIRETLANPYGAVVVAGPTGSGKSCTLYSMMNERRLGGRAGNIVTVEDPVEYLMEGVTQVQVSGRKGLGFSGVLRGLMRQDPDVIMVGELRDGETCGILVEAALTGHLTLTSTHGNNAMAVIQRLQQLGSDPVLLSQALALVVVQRLARRLCSQCATEAEVAPALLENLVARGIVKDAGAMKFPRAVGCSACEQQGYRGRIPVQEVLWMDPEVCVALAKGATPEQLVKIGSERRAFLSFAQSAAYLMARRLIAPADALLVVSG